MFLANCSDPSYEVFLLYHSPWITRDVNLVTYPNLILSEKRANIEVSLTLLHLPFKSEETLRTI